MTQTKITKAELVELVSFPAHAKMVRSALFEAVASPDALLRFLARYTSWNGYFGSGVATLAGKIGRTRCIFLDPTMRIRAVADRSVYVASYFFDAARDEFDDRDTVHRDTHRCLAQATLLGTAQYFAASDPRFADDSLLDALTEAPGWLIEASRKVAEGYGAKSADSDAAVFTAIGYHLGSELLADQEFSLIDEALKDRCADLVKALQETKVEIAGQQHAAYQWISIHSGHGGGVEADHFAWATKGAQRALKYTPDESRADMRKALYEGFCAFANQHQNFFEQVNDVRN